ncbi:uncharacterized protein LOC115746986 [Rhodamnia argentea]|uniref:Uncharacterized protein LOC115746986 n=1 Tax=Rhodamnia argentea TaxID=178133 RepID=A0A8B8PVP8_9MYRT|nr:uncharacterized protein LOC115746986 [Rhodamnia argentea]
MACIDTYNSDQPQYKGVPIGARISFSNDFVDPNYSAKQDMTRSPRAEAAAAAASADFEFFSLSSAAAVAPTTGFSMMSADELFFKGRLLPLKDAKFPKTAVTTLRDELLMNEDEDDDSVFVKPPKGSSTRWKGFLGLKKTSHTPSKRSVETISDEKFVEFEFNSEKCDLASDDHKTITPGKASPDVTNHGGSDRGDTEMVL